MSLNDAANYLKAHGRGNDTELVHMSRDEVNSLRHLAQSHGGDLSVNPHTGLKEAGFLDSILPMVIGGATAVFAPEALPYVAGATGLANYAKSGSLMQGISAGLGAYGAGSLASGLAASGYASAADTAVNSAVNSAAEQGLTGDAYNKAIQDSVTQSMATNGSGSFGSNVMGGIGNVGSGANGALGFGQVAKYGAMAAAPVLLNSMSGSGATAASNPNTARITPYTYASNPIPQSNLIGAKYVPGQDTSERTYFSPQYTALPPYTYTSADGGQVPPPTSFNNPNAPMSQDKNTTYANYSQMPMPQNPMSSGATLMANGGVAGYADRGMVDMKSNDMADMSEFGNLQNARNQLPPMPIGQGVSVMPNTNMTLDQFKQNPSGTVAYNTSLSPKLHAGVSASGEFDKGAQGVHNVAMSLFKQTSPDSGISAYLSKAPGRSPVNAAGVNYQYRFADGGNAMTADGQLIDPATGMPYQKNRDPLSILASMGQSGQHFSTPFASGGETGGDGHLGDYSDGGRLLRGPGDGVSDSIPATIAGKQPARLADGEFVVPARIVSELGNGSTEAGARKLYAMLDRIQHIRRESVGKGKVAKDSKADRYLPA